MPGVRTSEIDASQLWVRHDPTHPLILRILIQTHGSYLVKSEKILKVLKRILNENPPAPYTPQNKKKIVRVLKEAVEKGESREVRAQHKLALLFGKELILRVYFFI